MGIGHIYARGRAASVKVTTRDHGRRLRTFGIAWILLSPIILLMGAISAVRSDLAFRAKTIGRSRLEKRVDMDRARLDDAELAATRFTAAESR